MNVNRTDLPTTARVNVGSLFGLLKKINYHNYFEMTHNVHKWRNVQVSPSGQTKLMIFFFSLSQFFYFQLTILVEIVWESQLTCCWFWSLTLKQYHLIPIPRVMTGPNISLVESWKRNMKLNIPFLICFSYFTSQSLGFNFQSEDKNIYVKNRYLVISN